MRDEARCHPTRALSQIGIAETFSRVAFTIEMDVEFVRMSGDMPIEDLRQRLRVRRADA